MNQQELDKIAAKLSLHVYGTPREIKERTVPDLRLIDEKLFAVDDIQCLVANIGDITTVSFRGTRLKHFGDWFTDLKFDLVDNQNGPGRIHRGFADSVEKVFPDIRKEVNARKPELVLVGGHSKGAGEGIEFCVRLGYTSDLTINLTTFGCPRTVDKECAKWLSSRVKARRFVNCADAITKHPKVGVKFNWKTFPPSYQIQLGYKHFGRLCYFDTNGRFYENPPKSFIFFDRCKARYKHLGKWGTAGLECHSMPKMYYPLVCKAVI